MKKRVVFIALFLAMVFGCGFGYAAADPNVNIVNPANAQTIYADSLLVSVRVSKAETIQVKVFEAKKPAASDDAAPSSITLEDYTANLSAADKIEYLRVGVLDSDKLTYTANLSFYTKKLEKISPGVYIIHVDTFDADGAVIYSNESYVGVKAKADEPSAAASGSTTSGTLQFLKSLLKSIFGE